MENFPLDENSSYQDKYLALIALDQVDSEKAVKLMGMIDPKELSMFLQSSIDKEFVSKKTGEAFTLSDSTFLKGCLIRMSHMDLG